MRRHVSANAFVRLGIDLSRRLREDRPDLVHVQYTAPLACPVPIVVSVHDISFIEHPDYFPWLRAVQLRHTVPRTLHKAARVLTPSQFSRSAILRSFDLDPGRVEVVPIAVSGAFRPLAREAACSHIQKRYHIRGPFILAVGDLQPRKNQIGLIRAFEQLMREHPKLPHSLVIVGKDTWFAGRVRAAARQSAVAERIQFTSWVHDDDLIQLYNACEMSVFPSFYEGFGLPILEAMACGRAVACSNTSAMPEVADSAALLFNPESQEEIVRAMRDLLLDIDLRTRMERLGHARASLFTWDRTARHTLGIYYQVAGATVPVFPEAPVQAAPK
jgi:glycosyltransferase involved in cell wall biosynthesis